MTKVLQILPRGTQQTSNPKIVDITLVETQTSIVTQTIPNNKIQKKVAGTQTELSSVDKEDKITHTTISKEDLIQSGKTQFHSTLRPRYPN